MRTHNDGEAPTPEREPTVDQESALTARIDVGLKPFADLARWRPHWPTLCATAKVSGGWASREVAGPSTVDFCEEWQKSWDVCLFAMTVLGAAAFMGLGRYALHHRKLTDTHIQVWLVGRADARCHSEHLEWVRRRCGADHSQGLCPDSGSTRRSVLDQHRGATCPFACLPRAVPCLWKDPKWWLGREGGSEEAEPVKEDVDGGTAGREDREFQHALPKGAKVGPRSRWTAGPRRWLPAGLSSSPVGACEWYRSGRHRGHACPQRRPRASAPAQLWESYHVKKATGEEEWSGEVNWM